MDLENAFEATQWIWGNFYEQHNGFGNMLLTQRNGFGGMVMKQQNGFGAMLMKQRNLKF